MSELVKDEKTSAAQPLGNSVEAENNQELKKLLSKLPRKALAEALAEKPTERIEDHQLEVVRTVSQEFSGPIPPPSLLNAYEQVKPGFADRIVSMAEQEQAHRQLMEKTAIMGAIKTDSRGQNYALYCSVLVILGSMALIYTGSQWAGGIFGVGSVTGLAYIFIAGRKKNARKSDNKSADE